MQEDIRHIEDTFPVKEVSEKSVSEWNQKRGHIKMLHIWWARRPLVASRSTVYASLTPAPPKKNYTARAKERDFIIKLSKWEDSLNAPLIEKAKDEILKANGGKPPKILDPFGGGGAIPLEALRLGCKTYSSDLNPVSVLIQKCTLVYPQRYSKHIEETDKTSLVQNLQEDVKKWGDWVINEAKKQLTNFYPKEVDGSIPTGYIWARTIPCQNPSCGVEIPLMRSFWLVNKPNTKAKTKIALYMDVDKGQVEFKIVGDGYDQIPNDFLEKKPTVKAAVAECPVCRGTIPSAKTQQLFQNNEANERMVAVVTYKLGVRGKHYRIATDDDIVAFERAKSELAKKRAKLMVEWGIDPLPQEPLPPKKSHRAVGSQLSLYNFEKWGDLFNARQNLAMITLVEKVRLAYHHVVEEHGSEYAKAVVSYLALILSRHSSYNATLCWWEAGGERISNVFSRQTLAMVYDYAEQNPYGILTGCWTKQVKESTEVIAHLSSTLFKESAHVAKNSATNLQHHDNFFDAVFTDPPYYDNVPYSYLSDFFYIWLKLTLGDIYPELFSTPLTPKTNEIVKYSDVPEEFTDGNHYFESLLKASFQEIYRVLRPNGIALIVYAHKTTAGWETLINSLLDSGLIVTGAWPLRTEKESRLNAKETASLRSSIYIVTRKMKRAPTVFYNKVKEEMTKHLNEKLHSLWEDGLSGADFFIAAIGSAIEIFGKYEKVMDFNGNTIRADRFLDDVRNIATDYAVREILENGFAGEISDLTRFYLLWRWEYGTKRVPFDDARKLAQSCRVDITHEWGGRGFIQKEKQFIRVLGPQDRDMSELKGMREMIDVLHYVLLLWEKSQRDEMSRVLAESHFTESDAFFRVAQAISETLTQKDKERLLLEGFLGGNGWDRIETTTEQDEKNTPEYPKQLSFNFPT